MTTVESTAIITSKIEQFLLAVDACNWTGAESLMANPFHLDYESFGAGPAEDLAPREIFGRWKGLLPGFDKTHHHLGPLSIEVTGSEAIAKAHVTATHYIAKAEGGELWTVYGDYVFDLGESAGNWKITGLRLNFKFLTGNTKLPELAQERAKNLAQ